LEIAGEQLVIPFLLFPCGRGDARWWRNRCSLLQLFRFAACFHEAFVDVLNERKKSIEIFRVEGLPVLRRLSQAFHECGCVLTGITKASDEHLFSVAGACS